MAAHMQNTSHAVMAQRAELKNSLDDFPTPPWATRALLEHVVVVEGRPQLDDLSGACLRPRAHVSRAGSLLSARSRPLTYSTMALAELPIS